MSNHNIQRHSVLQIAFLITSTTACAVDSEPEPALGSVTSAIASSDDVVPSDSESDDGVPPPKSGDNEADDGRPRRERNDGEGDDGLRYGGDLDGWVRLETDQAVDAPCTFPRFTYYPGNSFPPRERYGQVDVDFEVCANESPSSWEVRVDAQPNRIGAALLYDFQSETSRVIGSGDDREGTWRTYQSSFAVVECRPVCAHRGTFTINFHAEVPKPGFGNPFVAYQSRSAPYPFALYSTQ